MNSGNPYKTGESVGSTGYFVGRQDILDEVKAVLEQKKAIILHGQRRIGKTSVLDELNVILFQEGHYVPVYFSLDKNINSSLEEVLQELANRIRDAVSLSSSEPNLDADHNRFFTILLPELLKKLPSGKSLVLLLDEFEIWAAAEIREEAKQASALFFPYLIDLLESHNNIKFVFAIGRRFADLNVQALRAFRMINDTIRISLLKKEETQKIIRFSEDNKTLKWSTEAIEIVWKQTAGHPFLTQTLCEKVWAICNKNDSKLSTISDVEKTITEILKNDLPAFGWIWTGLTSNESLIASALATRGSEPVTQLQLEDILRKKEVPIESNKAILLLQESDLIEPVEENGYRFRVELLRRWIAKFQPFNQTWDKYRKTDEAIQYYNKAKELYDNGNSADALEALNKAVSLNSDLMAATQLLAKILLENEPIDDIEYICGLLRRAYDYGYELQNTQPLYVKALLKSAKLASNEEKQLNLYERILEIEPENPEAKSIVSSRFIQLALLLAKISKSDDEQLMLYEPVLELEPDHETANKQRQIILQRQSKHSVKSIPLDSQIETLNTFANKVKATEKKQSASLIGVGAILIILIVLVGFQSITLAKLEKSVMRFYSEQLQEQKEENQQLKEKNEKLDVEIQDLNEELSPSSVKYQIKSTDTRLVYIVKKCYDYGKNDKRKNQCAKLIEEYNNVSPTELIAGEYLNIPNRPKEGCKLNRPPSCR